MTPILITAVAALAVLILFWTLRPKPREWAYVEGTPVHPDALALFIRMHKPEVVRYKGYVFILRWQGEGWRLNLPTGEWVYSCDANVVANYILMWRA